MWWRSAAACVEVPRHVPSLRPTLVAVCLVATDQLSKLVASGWTPSSALGPPTESAGMLSIVPVGTGGVIGGTSGGDGWRCRSCGGRNVAAGAKCVRCGDSRPAIAPRPSFLYPTTSAPAEGTQPESPTPRDKSASRCAHHRDGGFVQPRKALWGAVLLAALVFLVLVMDPTLPVVAIVLTGLLLLRRLTGKKPRPGDGRLPSHPSSGQVIGGFLTNLEHVVTGQPRPVAQIEEQYHEPWASIGDVTIEGLDEPIERPKRPDRSRARL